MASLFFPLAVRLEEISAPLSGLLAAWMCSNFRCQVQQSHGKRFRRVERLPESHGQPESWEGSAFVRLSVVAS
jgi:hypothetical protein